MHTAAQIIYLALAILFAFIMVQSALGLLPNARPRFWSSRVTGYKNVKLSKFSLISLICLCFGSTTCFAGAAFAANAIGFIGLVILMAGLISVSISRFKDVQLVRRQRLANLMTNT